jgi:sugar phosphate isomerase/epimerase
MFEDLSIGLWSLDSTHYWGESKVDTVSKIRAASTIEGLGGVELIYPTQVNEKNLAEVKKACADGGLKVVSVNPNVWSDPLFAKGSFTSYMPEARRLAIEYGKVSYDLAKELGAGYMCLWPGQDGYDYPFQVNYDEVWALEKEGILAVARHAEGHKIGIEYKSREPRSHILLDSVSTVLLFSRWIEAGNVGVHLDFGHALLAKENPAESVAKAMGEGKLFGVHLNDNYGSTDEDMLPLSVHNLETMEFLHGLRSLRYEGWVSFEFAARSEDPVEACAVSIRNFRRLERALDRLDIPALARARAEHSALKALELANAALMGA